jgi:hypothetical protein
VGDILPNPTREVHRRTSADPALPWIGAIGLPIAVGIAYFFAAQLSLALLGEADGIALFWPAAGVSSGVLIARGRNARLPVAVGVIVATIVANLMGDRNVWSATLFAFQPRQAARCGGLLAAAVVATAASGIGGTVAVKLFHSPAAPICGRPAPCAMPGA